MKKIILLTSFVLISSGLFAQYNFAIGIRSGGTSGVTFKSITSSSNAIEGIIGFWNDGLSITGLYEKHPNAFGVEGFHWLLGAGGHLTLYNENLRGRGTPAWYADHPGDIGDGDLGLGIDAIAGLEFKFPVIPLALSFELKPFIEFTTDGVVWVSFDPGLGLKLAF